MIEGREISNFVSTEDDLDVSELDRILQQRNGSQKFESLLEELNRLHLGEMDPYEAGRDLGKLPFAPKRFEFSKLASTPRSHVYLLEPTEDNRPSYVIKIQKITGGGGAATVEEEAGELKREYERIKDIYADVPEILPKEFTVITDNPEANTEQRGAVVLVQRFYGRELKDLFLDFTESEIVDLAASDPNFADSLSRFIERTLDHEQSAKEVIDFLSYQNVVVAKQGDSHHLRLLDPHVTYATGEGSYAKKDIDHWLAFLSRLGQRLDLVRQERAAQWNFC